MGGGVDLRPYAPRGALEWIETDPGSRGRAAEGTLVFVDISGFTAMSERLARLGRVGAEEVTDLLNHTFSRLLAVAYEDAGTLLKFGGDALLVLFEGPRHVERGVQAAGGMRRKLRELQPLESSAGQVRLRMSIGVHTGTVEQVLVGSHHRELFVVGKTASETVRMEGLASAGEIVVSQAVVDRIGPDLVTTPRDDGHLVRALPKAPVASPRRAHAAGGSDAARGLLSEQVRRQLESGATEGEHRASVVAFVKLTGLDSLVEERGLDGAAAALEEVVDVVVAAAAEHEVCVLSSDVDADGAKVILTAGVPTSQEFDGERMLRALRHVVEADLPVALKVGVHHGPVFAGSIGPPFRLTYTIIGDAVNLAARVMGRAGTGEIVATPEVLNRAQALFEVEALEPFTVKGKRRPVTAFRVGPVTGSRVRRSASRFRLAGRQAELAEILRQVDRAHEGPGCVVHLTGEAGIGKSRLVDEVHERRPEARFASAAGSRYEATTAYFVVAQLLRGLTDLPPGASPEELEAMVRRHAPDLLSQLPLLGDVLAVAVPDNDQTRHLTSTFRAARAADAVSLLLEAVLPEPAVVVLEDLHWHDPESLGLLSRLVGEVLPRRRWAFLTTSRASMAAHDLGDGAVEIALHPLSEADARDLVYTAVEEGLVTLDRGQRVLELAEGNPMFLEELLRVGSAEELPESVEALVQTELDQLPHPYRELLSQASVLGAEIDPTLLEAITGVEAAAQRRSFRELDAFIVPGPDRTFRFRHALLHDAAYGRLPFRRRRELHLAAAAALEARRGVDPRPDLLSVHTFRAREWRRARGYAIEAAEHAAGRFANLTAAELYRRAIDAGRHVAELPEEEVSVTWEHLGQALMRASSYEEAVRAYQQARRLAPPDRQAHLCSQLGQLRERQGRYADALRWLTRGARERGPETGRLLVEAAVVRARQGKPKQARALADQGEAATTELATLAKAAYVRAWCAMLEGTDGADDRARALALFEEADDLIGQGLAYNIISMSAYYRGDWDEAAEAYEHAARLRHRVGDEVASAAATGNLGELLADQGHFRRARGLLEECRSVCGAAGFRSSRFFASMTLGRLDARVGDFGAAEEQIVEALAAFEDMSMHWFVFDARRYLAELELFRGAYPAALEEADRVEALATLGSSGFRSVADRLRTGVAVAKGDRDGAVELALALAERLDHDARDYDTALGFVMVAVALEQAGHDAAPDARRRADAAMARLGVVVPGELLVLGPCSPLVPSPAEAGNRSVPAVV